MKPTPTPKRIAISALLTTMGGATSVSGMDCCFGSAEKEAKETSRLIQKQHQHVQESHHTPMIDEPSLPTQEEPPAEKRRKNSKSKKKDNSEEIDELLKAEREEADRLEKEEQDLREAEKKLAEEQRKAAEIRKQKKENRKKEKELKKRQEALKKAKENIVLSPEKSSEDEGDSEQKAPAKGTLSPKIENSPSLLRKGSGTPKASPTLGRKVSPSRETAPLIATKTSPAIAKKTTSSPLPAMKEEHPSEKKKVQASRPTSPLSKYQQEIIQEGLRDKVSDRTWKLLRKEDKLAEAINKIRKRRPSDTIDVRHKTTTTFKLTINGKPMDHIYQY